MNTDLDDIINKFQILGVTAQETKLYVALLESGNVNGYQLSKNAGIPSSKIYGLIDKMLKRGFIIATETRPQRYFPQDPDKVLDNLKNSFSASINTLQSSLKKYQKNDLDNGLLVWNVPTRQDIVKKAHEIIDAAEIDVFLAIWPEDLKSIQSALTRAQDRGVAITVVSYGNIKRNIGKVYQHRPSDYPSRERGERRFVLVVDNRQSIIANFCPKKVCGGLFTENTGLVQVFRDFVIHEIYLIQVEQKFPDQIAELVGRDWENLRLF